jgi:hypothetical protein
LSRYLARDARLDDWVGAKRIEWGYTDNDNFTWMALTDTSTQGFACGNLHELAQKSLFNGLMSQDII